MKTLVVFFCCMIAAIYCATLRQWPPEMEIPLVKCSTEHNINKDVAQKILSHIIPAKTENDKCLMACYMQERGYLVDHKINWEPLYESHAARIPNPEIREKVKETFDKCEANFSYEGKNDCQIAYDAYNCKDKYYKD